MTPRKWSAGAAGRDAGRSHVVLTPIAGSTSRCSNWKPPSRVVKKNSGTDRRKSASSIQCAVDEQLVAPWERTKRRAPEGKERHIVRSGQYIASSWLSRVQCRP